MASDDRPRPSARLNPSVAWTAITDAPLLGLDLAREANVLLAWGEANHLWLLDGLGRRRAEARAPGRVLGADFSDDGTLAAVLVEGARLLLLGAEFEPVAERVAPGEAQAVAVDPHGRYVAVVAKGGKTQLYTRHARPAGSFTTMQPLANLRFVASRPLLLGASAFGTLFGIELTPADAAGTLNCEEVWRSQMMSNVGRLEATGDGGMVLASCFTHGIQRFGARGRNEGAYHLGGTAAHAVPDFDGRTIAVATTEGELFLLNGAGNVRWKTGLPRGPIALECDALGRFLIYGLPTGEITRLDLDGARPSAAAGEEALAAATGADAAPTPPPARVASLGGSIRTPAWTIPAADSDEQAESAVVAVLDAPPRIGLITNRNQLTVLTPSGGALGQAPRIVGVGRFLRTAPGWILAATDRQVMLYDARRNAAQRLDLNLVELTHLVPRPDTYGLALVQERDRLGRSSLAGRWVWKRELRSAVEELAVGPDALTAVTSDDGLLTIYDPGGEPCGSYTSDPAEPLLLAAAPAGSPAEVTWITLARRVQVLRGHRRDGRVAWESPVPWEAWQLHPISDQIVAEAPDGRALAFDGSGRPRTQSRSESALGPLFAGPDGAVCRVVRQGEHLICSELSGRARWRAIAHEPIGPMAAARPGVAVLIGRSLAWFPEGDGSGAAGF